MKSVTKIADVRAAIATARASGKRIGLVPTMGNLHAGHLSLIMKAKQHADFIVVSVFVNPLQFAPHEDFDSYPRTLDHDQIACEKAQVDVLFVPTSDEVHGTDNRFEFDIIPPPALNTEGCASSRPHFFQGVVMVVNKLFNMVQPDVAVFGKKDYQQGIMIQKMVQAFHMPIEVMMSDTVREASGLAMSSRNQYLSSKEKQQAAQLNQLLVAMKQAILQGNVDYLTLVADFSQRLRDNFELDYLEVFCRDTLAKATQATKKLVIAAAVYLGGTRLIDNIEVDVPA